MEIKATSLARHGYGKGWQINALIDGVESEMTYYNVPKAVALEQAHRQIKENGRLLHKPYRGAHPIFKGFKVSA